MNLDVHDGRARVRRRRTRQNIQTHALAIAKLPYTSLFEVFHSHKVITENASMVGTKSNGARNKSPPTRQAPPRPTNNRRRMKSPIPV